jgi:hypothetical protein
MAVAAGEDRDSFRHIALTYGSPQEYLDYLVTFVGDGVAEGVPVLIAVPGPSLALLRSARSPGTIDAGPDATPATSWEGYSAPLPPGIGRAR